MASSSRIALDNWLKTIEVRGKILDVGGSPQTLEGRVKVFEPTEYLIMDNNAEKKFHKKWHNPDIKFDIQEVIIDLGDEGIVFDYDLPNNFREFNQIFMIEVSEYLYDPLKALRGIYELLEKGGKFYSSWHFIYPKHQLEGQDLLRYTDWGVQKLHELSGFKDIKITPRVAENGNDLFTFYSKERMRAAKGFNHGVIGWMSEAVK